MEVLEIKPLKNKKISVYLINDKNMKKTEEIGKLIEFFKSIGVKLSTIDIEYEEFNFFSGSSLAKLLNKLKIPYFPVDIPEYVKGYLDEQISQKEDQITELSEEYFSMKDKDSFKGQNLLSWIDMLTQEVKEEYKFLEFKLRPQWIVKEILDIIKSYQDEEITLAHFAKEKTITEVLTLLKEVEIEVVIYKNNKK